MTTQALDVGTREVTVPGCMNHAGRHAVVIALRWACSICGEPRGEPFRTLSYDGSRRLAVHAWQNPCGHADPYWEVRTEAGVQSCSPETWPHG